MSDQTNLPAQTERHSLKEVAIANHGLGAHLVPQSMADVVRFSQVMATGTIAIRKHLRDNPGACLAVTLQAIDWGMNPISVANKSYAVNDQLAYEAQLIAAVILARAPISGRPRYHYEGEAGRTRQCTVEVKTLDGEVLTYTSPEVGKITPKNSPLWKTDEDQQLGYFSIRSLARRHFPEIILGAYDRDEAAGMRDVTPQGRQPQRSGLAARLAGNTNGDGFKAREIEAQPAHDPETGEIIETQNFEASSPAASSDWEASTGGATKDDSRSGPEGGSDSVGGRPASESTTKPAESLPSSQAADEQTDLGLDASEQGAAETAASGNRAAAGDGERAADDPPSSGGSLPDLLDEYRKVLWRTAHVDKIDEKATEFWASKPEGSKPTKDSPFAGLFREVLAAHKARVTVGTEETKRILDEIVARGRAM